MGRGSSKVGGGGRGRGGGLSTSDILSTRDMIAQRGLTQKQVDEVLDVAKDLFNKYGEDSIPEELQIATLSKRKRNQVLAYYDGANIAVNENYFDKNIEQSYKEAVKQKFHPSSGNKTGLQATVAHEYGHALNDAVARKMNTTLDASARVICEEARKRTNHKGVVKMANSISGYASYSNAETIAEAFCDVYCNGKKAKKESIAVVEVMNSYLKK